MPGNTLNRALRAVEEHDRPQSASVRLTYRHNAAGASDTFREPTPAIWARILSGANPYAWEEVQRVEVEPFVWAFALNESGVGVGGESVGYPLYECNGNAQVAAGEVHRAWLAESGDHWLFNCCQTNGGTFTNTMTVAVASTTVPSLEVKPPAGSTIDPVTVYQPGEPTKPAVGIQNKPTTTGITVSTPGTGNPAAVVVATPVETQTSITAPGTDPARVVSTATVTTGQTAVTGQGTDPATILEAATATVGTETITAGGTNPATVVTTATATAGQTITTGQGLNPATVVTSSTNTTSSVTVTGGGTDPGNFTVSVDDDETTVIVKGGPNQANNLFEVELEDETKPFQLNPEGRPIFELLDPIDDADLDEGQFSFSLDDTTGAPIFSIKGTDDAGTPFTTAIPLENGTTGGGASPAWIKVTKGFADFATAATLNTITLHALPAKGVLQRVIIKHTAAFTGGGATSVSVSVQDPIGTSVPTEALGVFQAPADDVFGNSASITLDGIYNFGSAEDIDISLEANVNLDQLTTGSVDVYLLIGTLP